MFSAASSSPIATTTPPVEREWTLPVKREAGEGTGFRLTGSILGAGSCWRDDGDLDVEACEGEGSSLGRPRSIMLHTLHGFGSGSIMIVSINGSGLQVGREPNEPSLAQSFPRI